MKNADLFKDTFETYATEIWSMPENDFLKWLNEDAKPKTGHWKRNETIRLTYCSKCGFGQHIDEFRTYNYCPNCGACMKDCRTLDEFIEDSKESEG